MTDTDTTTRRPALQITDEASGATYYVELVARGETYGPGDDEAPYPLVLFFAGDHEDYDMLLGARRLRDVQHPGGHFANGQPIEFPSLRDPESIPPQTADAIRSWITSTTYEFACQNAATDQGLDPIMSTLAAAGVEYSLDQTGGYCMAVSVRVIGGTYVLSNDGEVFVGWYPGEEHWLETDEDDVTGWNPIDPSALALWAHTVARLQTATIGNVK
jgi:hypothetical protein